MTKIKIDVSQDVTNRLPFVPYPQFGNMCPGYLTSVEVTTSDVDADSKWEYAGMTVPRLSFHFTEHKLNADDKDRFFTHSELPIAHVKVNGEDVSQKSLETMYIEMWKRIKNIHDQFAGNPNYKVITDDLDFDLDLDKEDRVAAFTTFFKNMAKAFNKGKDNKTPIYSGKDLLLLKLVASGKKLTYLGFPTFIGTGMIQKVNIKNGKIDTTLAFRPSETVELGVSATANATEIPATRGGAELPAGLAEKLGIG